MNVFILTQEDAFYIPKLLQKFIDRLPRGANVVGAAILQGEIRTSNIRTYLEFLGPWAFLQNSTLFAAYRLGDLIDRLVPTGKVWSVHGTFRRNGIDVYHPVNINDPTFSQTLQSLGVDLVASVACPQIVRKELLTLPPRGIINIHGALLPDYRGRMPSFWVLAKGETETGVTVHYMNEKIDEGEIIVQKRVPIASDDTLHSLVLKSKVGYGAEALAEAVEMIMNDTVVPKANDPSLGRYFSKPTAEAVKEFRGRGRRFR